MTTLSQTIVEDILCCIYDCDSVEAIRSHFSSNEYQSMMSDLTQVVDKRIESAYPTNCTFTRNADDTATISTDKYGKTTTWWDDDGTQ